MVIAGKFRAPGGVRDKHGRIAERQKKTPAGEPEEACIRRRGESHEGGERDNRDAEREERAAASEAGSGPVANPSHGGVADRVEQPDDQQREADTRQRQTESFGVVGRHQHIKRQGECRERNGRQRIGEQQRQGECACLPAALVVTG